MMDLDNGSPFITFYEREEAFLTSVMDEPISDEELMTRLNQFGALSDHCRMVAMIVVACNLVNTADAVLPLAHGKRFCLHLLEHHSPMFEERFEQLEELCDQDGIVVKAVRPINTHQGEVMLYAFYSRGIYGC